jgi:DNA-binding NarL/FixJ family response regulator
MNELRPSASGRSSRAPRLWAAIVDDHPVYRLGLVEALRATPEIGVAWTAANPREALRSLDVTSVDVLITDLHFKSDTEGIELIREIRERWPAMAIVVVSGLADDDSIATALEAGANLFLPKDLATQEMLARLLALSGARKRGAVNGDSLSRREVEVLAEMRRGSTNREIARVLGVSTNTVNKHVHRILFKLNARNRAQAISLTNLH